MPTRTLRQPGSPFIRVGPTVLRRPHDPLRSASFAGCYREQVIADRAMAYYRLGETGTPTLVDELAWQSGLYVGTPTFGKKGALTADPNTAILLDGSGSAYGEVAGWKVMPAKPLTLEAWIAHDAADFTLDCCIAGWQNGAGDSAALMASTLSGSSMRLGIFTDSGNVHFDWTPNSGDKNWHHIVGQIFGPSMKFWFDGVDQSSGGTTAYVGGASTNPFRIGSTNDSGVAGTESWPGGIDEVAVYPYGLTPDQIVRHYQLALAGCWDPSAAGPKNQYDETDDWDEAI